MSDALKEIEDAIVEVTKARQSVKRKTSKQVTSVEEIARLKSIAYAWFKTHFPILSNNAPHADLSLADTAFKKLFEATGRNAARQTYVDTLLEAKRSLVDARTLVATTPNAMSRMVVSSPETAPSFAPLAGDPAMQEILERRWFEVQRCIGSASHLAATVMMGGLLESLLLARINASADQKAVFTAKGAPRDKAGKTLALGEWKLTHMVEVAHELSWVTKSAKDVGNVLRDFRNYIHPHKEYTDGIVISEEDARMFWEVTKAITRQVLVSVGKSR